MHRKEYNERAPSQAAIDIVDNSPESQLHRASGYLVHKEITLAGGAGAKTYDLFTVTGTVEVLSIEGVFTNVTDVTVASTAYWDANDGTNTVVLTKATGVDCSGAALNSVVFKAELAVNAAVFHNATQVRTHELEGHKQFQGVVITAKNGAATTIRFQVTQDGATDAQINFTAAWVHENHEVDSNLEAVG
jgi:hypothetical protein